MYDHALAQQCEAINLEFTERYELLGEGRHRRVYRFDPGYVVKVPHSRDYPIPKSSWPLWVVCDDIMPAIMANISEHEMNEVLLGHPCAETKLEYYNGVPILYMEYVKPLNILEDDMPGWAWSVDGGQVGIARDGTIKAYDYSED